jgi:hypothetical protein
MNHKTSKKISLEQLYQQRKDNHKLPEAVREQLQKYVSSKKQVTRSRWQFAIPIVFASLMTVVVIYPNREPVNDAINFVSATAPNADIVAESDIQLELEEDILYSNEAIQNSADYSLATRVAKEPNLSMKSMAEPSSEINSVLDDSVVDQGITISPSQSPVILLVTDGALGFYERCSGEQVHFNTTTPLAGWVIATWQNEQWHIKKFDLKIEPCISD